MAIDSYKKGAYITINTECDAIDELCVICLEKLDSRKVVSQPHTLFLNCECECNYYIHRSCFEKWADNRPTEISCLICLSKATQVLTLKQHIREYILTERCQYARKTCVSLTSWFICFMGLWVMLCIFEDKPIEYES